MGFTIEDMLLVSRQKYKMELVAGKAGWSNSISWMLLLEDFTILKALSGKELAVTTGLGFDSEEKMLRLIGELTEHNAAGLVINTGYYIRKVPDRVIAFCDEADFPLLTVPWEVLIVDMVKDLSIRIFLQGQTDEQIQAALIQAIEMPQAREEYAKALLPFFDTDGVFQVFLITSEGLDTMDTVERRRIAYRIQLYLSNITHNGPFFYYDGSFVLVMNAVKEEDARSIIENFALRAKNRMIERPLYIGAGSRVTDISSLSRSYRRAKAAARMAKDENRAIVYFDLCGVSQIFYSVEDMELLSHFSEELLGPLLRHDQEHGSQYVETLEAYLNLDGSIKAVSEALFTHRNTILYRVKNIKKLLGCELESAQERLPYQIAFYIHHMDLPQG